MNVFKLPDLGEGLPDAEIVEWLVEVGDEVKVDQPVVSMETAKAVVEVPSPFDGTVTRLHGKAGDVIKTGDPLMEFDGEEASDGGETTGTTPAPKDDSDRDSQSETTESAESDEDESERADSGTVVGNVTTSDEVVKATHSTVGGRKVTPAVRALARKLKVDLGRVEPSGEGGVVTADDVRAFADSGGSERAARQPAADSTTARQPEPAQPTPPEPRRTPGEQPAAPEASGEWEPLRGTRRTMARTMSDSHARVVPTTLMDDADLHAWNAGQDITARLLRAMWAAARVEPGLNAWFDDEQNMRMVHKEMHVGMAVDTADGLFVASLNGVHAKDGPALREEINRLRDNVKNRSIPPEDLKGYTIMLSNFGVFAGRYATPIINPPCVAILAAGKLRHDVVPVLGGLEVHRTMPLSLTFDHRAATGGEAARYLKALLEDLALPE